MRNTLVVPVVLVAFAALGHAACSSDTPVDNTVKDSGTTDTGSGDDTITIGVNLALTGTGAPAGQPAQQGTRVAQQQINSLGGVLGKKVVFEIVDDRTDNAVTKTVFEGFFGR